VVGVHGWAGDRGTFLPLVPHVADGASLWGLDLPGVGEATAPPAWSLDALLEPLGATFAAVAREAGRPVTVVASCSGANLAALALLAGDAAAVERLVLLDPFAYMPWYFRLFLQGELGRRAYRTTFANPVGRWLTNGALSRRRQKGTHMTRSFERRDHDATLAHLRLLGDVTVDDFRGLELPIRVLVGEKTFGAVHRSLDLWRTVWPQMEARVLPGVGHLPLEEATPEVAAAVFGPAGAGGGEGSP
jgi:pimeloyl-ACP methyl ester carboxylesterase